MKYERFEDLPVWQKAIELAEAVYKLTEGDVFRKRYGLRDQIERSALSVSNNIAEGFERGTTNELLQFIYIARGSAGEVRSMLSVKERRAAKARWSEDLKSQISNLKSTAESCSRQLRGWADSLQNSDIQGQRHLNEKVRQRERNVKTAKTYRLNFLRNLKPEHPLYRTSEARAARGEPDEP